MESKSNKVKLLSLKQKFALLGPIALFSITIMEV